MQGICLVGVIPVRKEPSHRSEMVTQLLFGELFSVLEEKEDWICILAEWDNYNGWIERKQAEILDEQEYDSLLKKKRHFVTGLLAEVKGDDDKAFMIPCGSALLNLSGNTLSIGKNQFSFSGQASEITSPSPQQVTDLALSFLHAPYLWGGRTVLGLDCSGFTQVVFKAFGIKIPRDSSEQALSGTPVNLISEAQEGDLAFFGNGEGAITHTGILLSDSKIIHSSGMVRTDQIDHHGIFDLSSRKYTHNLRTISRIL